MYGNMVRWNLEVAAASQENGTVPPATTAGNVARPFYQQSSIDSTETVHSVGEPVACTEAVQSVAEKGTDRNANNQNDGLPADRLADVMNADPTVDGFAHFGEQMERYEEVRSRLPHWPRMACHLSGINQNIRRSRTDDMPMPHFMVILELNSKILEARMHLQFVKDEWEKIKASRPCCLDELNRIHEPHENRDSGLYRHRHRDCHCIALPWRELIRAVTLRVANLELAAEKAIDEAAPVFTLRRSKAVRRESRNSTKSGRDTASKPKQTAPKTSQKKPKKTERKKVSFDLSTNLFGQEHRKRRQWDFKRTKVAFYKPGKWAPGIARRIKGEVSTPFPSCFASPKDKTWIYNDTFLNTSGYKGFQREFFGYDDPVESARLGAVEKSSRAEDEEEKQRPAERRPPVFMGKKRERRGSI
ncbi:hypothetical protein HDK90DRAFT_524790 [Phyllosticta capitalensis]|uniref:Uncharacterized protein n=1 Tax=Phyllosticta capitalensis TaxID=121624 RepID=A0ABR1YP22_9PEZI